MIKIQVWDEVGMPRPTVLTIAGSDSGGGAGIQGDLKTLEAFHVFGLSVLTSVTAQNSSGVLGVFDLPPEFVILQIKAVVADMRIDAVKTGLLASEKVTEVVGFQIKEFRMPNLVVDPVMRAKSGDPLITPGAQRVLLQHVFPLARIVTPNLPEAEQLSGISISGLPDMKEAARIIAGSGSRAVLIKGGHLEQTTQAVDVLFDGDHFYEVASERIDAPGGVHGTGCAYASAIAAGLALGLGLVDAVSQAKAYITEAIRSRYHVGQGHPVLDHAWRCSARKNCRPG